MKIVGTKILLLTMGLIIQFSAYATLIDFDNLPGGGTLAPNSILTNQYSSLGVNFSATEKCFCCKFSGYQYNYPIFWELLGEYYKWQFWSSTRRIKCLLYQRCTECQLAYAILWTW